MSDNEDTEIAEQEAWKLKYFDSLQKLEHKEAQWSSLEALLRNTVSRMAVALRGLRPELDDLLDELRTALRTGEDHQKLERLSRAIAEAVDRIESPTPGAAPAQGGGWFARLLGRSGGVEPLAHATTPALDTGDFSQLLDQLELEDEDAAERESLKALLNEAEPDWARLLTGIVELLSRVRSRLQKQKQELEQFFGQLSERLQSFDDLLQVMETNRADAAEATKQLDESFRAQVSDMHHNVHGAVDLAQLKNLVQQRLDALGGYMRTYLQSQQARSTAAQSRIEELSRKLVSMEAETGELRARIRQQREAAQIDPLTGCYNRLAYEERVEQEFARWKRFGTAVSLAVLDIDRFKSINDTYGHQAGDKVLSTIASVLTESVRETDFLARYGGEEFVLIMPGADAPAGRNVVEKLRKAVEQCGFHYRGDSVPITVSCGVTQFLDANADSPTDAFARADKAMYEAKQAGRNRCHLAGS